MSQSSCLDSTQYPYQTWHMLLEHCTAYSHLTQLAPYVLGYRKMFCLYPSRLRTQPLYSPGGIDSESTGLPHPCSSSRICFDNI